MPQSSIEELVEAALDRLPQEHTAEVVLNVFETIENYPAPALRIPGALRAIPNAPAVRPRQCQPGHPYLGEEENRQIDAIQRPSRPPEQAHQDLVQARPGPRAAPSPATDTAAL